MKKLTSSIGNMILSLVAITAIAGGLLGGMYALTKNPIERSRQEAALAAIRNVAPEFDNNPEAEAETFDIDGVSYTVYPARLDGQLVGAAVKGSSMNGFSGEITVMCGFKEDGTVKDYQVLQQAETPGLGSKMQAWFRDPKGARSVIGKNPTTTSFYVTKDVSQNGEIDGITAATISSRAFLETMRGAFNAYKKYNSDNQSSHNEK